MVGASQDRGLGNRRFDAFFPTIGRIKTCNWTKPGLRLAAMNDVPLYPRFLRPRVEEALADSPVVLIHGPRQCGKTTLARLIGSDLGYLD